jgi:hypothetical protein
MSAHVLDQSRSAAQSFLSSRAADADVLAVEVEIDLGVWHETGFLAKRDRDGDLALGGDAHGADTILTCESKKQGPRRQSYSPPVKAPARKPALSGHYGGPRRGARLSLASSRAKNDTKRGGFADGRNGRQ